MTLERGRINCRACRGKGRGTLRRRVRVGFHTCRKGGGGGGGVKGDWVITELRKVLKKKKHQERHER